MNNDTVLGLDLAGVESRPTGAVLAEGREILDSRELFSDAEIMAWALASGAKLAGIDAPLCLPPGRLSLEDRNGEHFRACDLALRVRGIRFFPITLGPMRALTERGIRLKARLEANGIKCLEMFPGASQDIWGVPRKGKGVERLREGLRGIGIQGITDEMSDHELDAVCCAVTGVLYLRGEVVVLGESEARGIVIPAGGRPF